MVRHKLPLEEHLRLNILIVPLKKVLYLRILRISHTLLAYSSTARIDLNHAVPRLLVDLDQNFCRS